MNNIVIHNAIREMDKMIERDMEETQDVVKNGRPCLREGCWLGKSRQCGFANGKWRRKCLWDLRDLEIEN